MSLHVHSAHLDLIICPSLDGSKAQAVVDEIKKAGGSAIAVSGDVGAEDFPEKIVQATVKEYGKINHIVNNAGFTYDRV